MAAVEEHLEALSRELSCSICLCLMAPPVARLPCCHYFCMGCIQQSVRHRAQCPVCKSKVGRRDINNDPTMDRVVSAFAALEARKGELVLAAQNAEAERANAGGRQLGVEGEEGQGPEKSASFFETARQSLDGGVSVALAAAAAAGEENEDGAVAAVGAADGAAPLQQQKQAAAGQQRQGRAGPGEGSPDTLVAPAAGGICWLAGVENEEYRSPSVSFAGSAQRQKQARAQALAAQQEARRLSLASVGGQAQPAGVQAGHVRQPQQQQASDEAGRQEAELAALPAGPSEGKENASEQAAAPSAGKPAASSEAAAGDGEGGSAWRQRGHKTAAAARQAAAERQRQAEGTRAITSWLKPQQQGGSARRRGRQAADAEQEEQEADWQAADAPADQPATAEPAVVAAAAAEPAGSAEAASPDASADLQGLLGQVHAMAAAVGGPADSGHAASGSGASKSLGKAEQGGSQGAEQAHGGGGGEHATPAQPAQAAAPKTDKVPAPAPAEAGEEAAGQAGEDAAEEAEVAAGGAGRKGRASGGGRSAGRRKRAASVGAAAAADATPAPEAAGGSEAVSKRGRTAAGTSGRRRKPAQAGPDADAGTPAPPPAGGAAAGVALPAASGGASAGAMGTGGGSRRRIPARLLPWNCAHCTFENQGAAQKCDMCGLKKKVLAAAELAAAAGGTPSVAGAAALQDVTPAAPVAAAVGGQDGQEDGAAGAEHAEPQQQQQQQAAAGGGGRHKQRKMSGGGAAAAGAAGGSGKRRRLEARAGQTPTAAAASPAVQAGTSPVAQPSPAVAPPAAGSWSSGGANTASWVLLGSSLSPAGKQRLQQLAAAAGGRVVREWSKVVTHVVCGQVDGAARRTFKFLMGLLSAQWVVTEDWAAACLQQGRPAEERRFLVERDHAGGQGGAAAALANAQLGLPALLQGYELFLAGDFSNREEVTQLLVAAGAKLLSRAPAAPAPRACSGPCTSFLLCDAAPGESGNNGSSSSVSPGDSGQGEGQARSAGSGGGGEGPAAQPAAPPAAVAASKWYRKAAEGNVPVVSHRWLTDSISSGTVRPLAGYRL